MRKGTLSILAITYQEGRLDCVSGYEMIVRFYRASCLQDKKQSELRFSLQSKIIRLIFDRRWTTDIKHGQY
jgi:hypothetical protein